jgi:hypothetical protein
MLTVLSLVVLVGSPLQVTGEILPRSGPKASSEIQFTLVNTSRQNLILLGPVALGETVNIKAYDTKGRSILFTSYAKGLEADGQYPHELEPGRRIVGRTKWGQIVQPSLRGKYTVVFFYRIHYLTSETKKWGLWRGAAYSKPIKVLITDREVRVI